MQADRPPGQQGKLYPQAGSKAILSEESRCSQQQQVAPIHLHPGLRRELGQEMLMVWPAMMVKLVAKPRPAIETTPEVLTVQVRSRLGWTVPKNGKFSVKASQKSVPSLTAQA